MGWLTYLAVLVGCLAAVLIIPPATPTRPRLGPVLRIRVLHRWRQLLLTLLVVSVIFVAWDLAAIAAGHWSFDPAQTIGIALPGKLPLEELLFFLVIPACIVAGFEAVRAVLGWPAGDEESEP